MCEHAYTLLCLLRDMLLLGVGVLLDGVLDIGRGAAPFVTTWSALSYTQVY